MKKWLILALAALLGGCVVVPIGERYNDHDRDYQNDWRDHSYRHYG